MTVGNSNIIIPFDTSHLEWLMPQEDLPTGMSEVLAVEYSLSGPAFTGITAGNEVIGSAGITLLWEGVGQAWMVPGPAFRESILWIIRIVRGFLCEQPLHRIQTFVRTDSKRFTGLVELLGFTRETLMKSFGPGKRDCYLYSIVR